MWLWLLFAIIQPVKKNNHGHKKTLQVTIVGGGFGGIKAALELAKDQNASVTLISDKPDFQYYPTLYSSATGHSHMESWAPLGEIFADHPNIHVYIDAIERINADAHTVYGVSGASYHYETLIMAVGVMTSYFGIPGLETYSYGIKNQAEIKKLKQRLFVDIAEKRQLDRNYVVVGAGPTGVELAAALGTYLTRLTKHYGVKKHHTTIRLIEAAPRVLPRSSPLTSRMVARRLRRIGVRVQTSKKVERENIDTLVVSGQPIASHTVIWTSGVSNHPLFAAHPDVFTLAKNGRVVVDEYLQAYRDIYVIGDNAATPYTGLAQTAIRDGVTVARNLRRMNQGEAPKKYRPRLPVSAIPVGKRWAVVEWRWVRIYGWVGAVIRRLANLVGYSEIMPFGTSLGAWHASKTYENDYFTPTLRRRKIR